MELLSDWHNRAQGGQSFSVHEIERLVGLLNWVTTAAPAIRPLVATTRSVLSRYQGRRAHLVLPADVVAAIDLLFSFFTTWSRAAPILLGFTPVVMERSYSLRCLYRIWLWSLFFSWELGHRARLVQGGARGCFASGPGVHNLF